MGYKRDNAPVGHTCPLIDSVIDFLSDIEWDLGDDNERDLAERSSIALDTLEDVRKANDALRAWGNEKHLETEEFEAKVSALERTISNHELDIEHYREQVAILENRISDLEYQIEDLKEVKQI
jgi:predicted  nucleic acid-binding Zn-ribbon protein